MTTPNGNGSGRIHLLNDHLSPKGPKTDDQGRRLTNTASVKDAHDIAIEEGNKIHEFYLKQVPPFVARMIQDALMAYGLIQVTPEAQLAATPPTDQAEVAQSAEQPPRNEQADGSSPSLSSDSSGAPAVADVATDGSEGPEA